MIPHYFFYLHTCVFYMHILSIVYILKAGLHVINGHTQRIIRNEGDMAYNASFQICLISYTFLINMITDKNAHIQKSEGFRYGKRAGQGIDTVREMTRSSEKLA